MLLNYPETIPATPVCGKIVFHELVPGAKKVGGCYLRAEWGLIGVHTQKGVLQSFDFVLFTRFIET